MIITYYVTMFYMNFRLEDKFSTFIYFRQFYADKKEDNLKLKMKLL
jgi:hypothetical protein